MRHDPNHRDVYREERPWGIFEAFTYNEVSTVKIITVWEGERTSLQYHHYRDEWWRVLDGHVTVVVGDVTTEAQKDDDFFVPRGTQHQLIGGESGGRVLEISFGSFDEDDIVRLDDPYKRKAS